MCESRTETIARPVAVRAVLSRSHRQEFGEGEVLVICQATSPELRVRYRVRVGSTSHSYVGCGTKSGACDGRATDSDGGLNPCSAGHALQLLHVCAYRERKR